MISIREFQDRARPVLLELMNCSGTREYQRLLLALISSTSGFNPTQEDFESLESLEGYIEKKHMEESTPKNVNFVQRAKAYFRGY